MGEPVAIVLAKDRYLAEDAAARVEVDLRCPACGRRLSGGRACRCTEGAARVSVERHLVLPDRIWRGRRCVPWRSPFAAREILHPSRRSAFDRRPRHSCRIPQERRLANGMGLDPEGARPVQHARASPRHRRELPACRDAGRRRRLRPEALRLCGGCSGHGRREALETLGHLDRGPSRALPRRGPGARPALGDGDRGRGRRPHPRLARAAAARSRRLCAPRREPTVQLGVDADRPLHGAGLRHGRRGHRHQQDAGLLGARRRLSAGLVHHGTPARPAGARARHGARGVARAQSHPGREDALSQAAQDACRRNHRLRQRQLSRRPGGGARRDRLGGLSGPAGEGPRRRPPDRHRARPCHEGDRARPVRVRRGARLAERANLGLHRRRRHGAGASRPRSRRSARASSAFRPRMSR